MSIFIVGCSQPLKICCGLEGKTHSAVVPAKTNQQDWWLIRHKEVLERIKQGKVDMLFIGDSITHGWEGGAKEYWDKYYAPRNAVNLGFNGDRTQDVLWRLDHGEIDGIFPKLAVLMIGTNNSNVDWNTAKEISEGVQAICCRLRMKLPHTKILILGVFPREEKLCA